MRVILRKLLFSVLSILVGLTRLSGQEGRLQNALQGAVSGLSPVSAAEITLRLTG